MDSALSSTEKVVVELRVVLGDFDRLVGYLGLHVIAREDQAFHVLCLDENDQLIRHWRLPTSSDDFGMTFRQVMSASLATRGTVSVVLAHRHTTRSPVATAMERDLRVQIKRALSNAGIKVRDYIIFGPASLWSYEEGRTFSYATGQGASSRRKAPPRPS